MGLLIHCLFWQKSRQNALFFCSAEKCFEGFGRDGFLKSGFRSHLSRSRDNLSRKNRDKPIEILTVQFEILSVDLRKQYGNAVSSLAGSEMPRPVFSGAGKHSFSNGETHAGPQ